MEKTSKKEQILDAALDLFSVWGYEATSISRIAEAVGVRKASLYNHFESKKAILDALLENIIEEYNRHSMFANADWEDPAFTKTILHMTPEALAAQVKEQLCYILHDSKVSRGRKMLVIEQFQNPELGRLHTKRYYDDVMNYHTGMIRYLIRKGVLREGDARLLAAEYCLPISVWLNLCDREPDREAEVMALIEKHILNFFVVYRRQPGPEQDPAPIPVSAWPGSRTNQK